MFKFNIEHEKLLKLKGRASRSFRSHKTRWIVIVVMHGGYLISAKKMFGNLKSKPQKHKEKPQNQWWSPSWARVGHNPPEKIKKI